MDLERSEPTVGPTLGYKVPKEGLYPDQLIAELKYDSARKEFYVIVFAAEAPARVRPGFRADIIVSAHQPNLSSEFVGLLRSELGSIPELENFARALDQREQILAEGEPEHG